MRTPPDIQVASILHFLNLALRQDKDIQKWTSARPDEIVAETLEFQPIQRNGGEVYLFANKMPTLALHVVKSKRHRRGGRWGRDLTLWLWYLFLPFQSDEPSIHGLTKVERWKSLIDWRLGYWLYEQKLPATAAEDEEVFNLQTAAKIRTMDVGDTEYFNEGEIEGLKMTLEVDHLWAPYEEMDPATFDLLDFEAHTFSAGTPLVAELQVEGDIDQT